MPKNIKDKEGEIISEQEAHVLVQNQWEKFEDNAQIKSIESDSEVDIDKDDDDDIKAENDSVYEDDQSFTSTSTNISTSSTLSSVDESFTSLSCNIDTPRIKYSLVRFKRIDKYF